MKKNDLAVIILIVSLSLVVSYTVGNSLLGGAKANTAEVESVDKISPTITQPDSKIFNANAINPTVPITIGNPSNQQPF